MQLLYILSSLLLANAASIEENDENDETNCEGVYVNDVYHDKEVLKDGVDRPYLLTVDYVTNTIFFSYSVNIEDDDFRTARLNINTKAYKDIEGVENGFAQAIDRKTNTVYIGGSNGIYKYDYNTNSAEFYGAKGENIWSIYFKDVIYYSTFPSQFLYTLSEGETRKFQDLEDTKVDHILIDNDDLIFYTNATGLYSQKMGSKNATMYAELFETNGVRGMTLNPNGTIYFCTFDGIYLVDKDNKSVNIVANITEVFGIAFDNSNHIIYSDANSLIRLIPNRKKSC